MARPTKGERTPRADFTFTGFRAGSDADPQTLTVAIRRVVPARDWTTGPRHPGDWPHCDAAMNRINCQAYRTPLGNER